ncbi:MAG: hypothetical protein KDE27_08895 [Planctomycetes bacterium]|nr:hypothetical protein [Planctomycetota bacterium]
MFLAQLAFFHFRMRTIGSARSLRRVRVAMRVRWARNINWSVSFSKVFPIRCRDEMWRTCVDMMLRETDMVVMDVSQPSASIEWELDRCRRSSPDRLVCVTPPALLERSRATLRNWGLPEPEIARRLLTFGRDGEAELRHRLARLRDRSARAPRAGVDRGAAEALFRGAQAHFSNAIAMVGPLPWVLAAVLALAAAKAN